MPDFSPSGFVYVVRCSERQHLIGVSTDPQRQLKTENGGLPFYFGECRQVVTLVYLEGPFTPRMAARREAEMRAWEPERLTAYIGFTERRKRRMRAELDAIDHPLGVAAPSKQVFHTARELSDLLSFIRDELEDEMIDRRASGVEVRGGSN